MSECAVSAHSDPASAEREARRLSKAIQVESLPSDPRISIKISNSGCSDNLGEGENETPGRKNKSTAAFVTLVIAAALLFGLIFTLFSFNFNIFEVGFNCSCFGACPYLDLVLALPHSAQSQQQEPGCLTSSRGRHGRESPVHGSVEASHITQQRSQKADCPRGSTAFHRR
jgi:hypothetical protein